MKKLTLTTERLKNLPLTAKILMISAMILLLLIPQSMVENLVHERMQRHADVMHEVSSKWGGDQLISGPLLSIPYSYEVEGRVVERNFCHIYPEELSVEGVIEPKIRKRSIFAAVLYEADLNFQGHFRVPTVEEFGLPPGAVLHYSRAALSFGVGDVRGLTHQVTVAVAGRQYEARRGSSAPFVMEQGFHVGVVLDDNQESYPFATRVSLRGSRDMSFSPVGRTTKVKLTSPWQHPSFSGSFLPVEREVGQAGFDAEWQVHELQRNFSQYWKGTKKMPANSVFGVKLIDTNNIYQNILRVIKYAILFIAFTFAALFISERCTGYSVHPLQYLLTGLAAMIFYVLLLSISEHSDFDLAYGITAVMTTGLIGLYGKGMFRGWKMSLVITAVTAGLYSFLFVVLQQEDYAMLMGTSGLFVVLATIMYLTRDLGRSQDTSSKIVMD